MSSASSSVLGSSARRQASFALYSAALLEGFLLAAPGPTLDALAESTRTSLGEVGALFTANGLGFVTGALVAGRLFSHMPGNRLIAGAVALMGIGAFAVPLATSLIGLLGIFVVIGLAIGVVDVGCNTLTVWLHGEDSPRHVNVLHLFWGMGAASAPLVVAWVASITGQPASSFTLFALLTVPTAGWLLRSSSPVIPAEAGAASAGSNLRLHMTFVGTMAVLFFLHVGAELAFGGWIYSYANAVEAGTESMARFLNSVFWAGLVIGRMLAIPISSRVRPGTIVTFGFGGAVVAVGVIAVCSGWEPALWIGSALFGVSIGPVFAGCINFTARHMQITSQVTAIFLIGASLGSMILPWVVGRLFVPLGRESMLYIVGGSMLVGLLLLSTIRIGASERR